MLVRYDIRPDPDGWTIFDRRTQEPAVIEGFTQVGLTFEDAEDLTDLLNTFAFVQRAITLH